MVREYNLNPTTIGVWRMEYLEQMAAARKAKEEAASQSQPQPVASSPVQTSVAQSTPEEKPPASEHNTGGAILSDFWDGLTME
jgi:hypothetical protein